VLHAADGAASSTAISSWWVTLHGHAEPAIAEAIAEQGAHARAVIFAGFTHAPAARLCARSAEVLPAGLERVFLTDNGSTAVEAGIKIALQWWQPRHAAAARGGARGRLPRRHVRGDERRGARRVQRAVRRHLFEVARLPCPARDGDATLRAFDALLAARGGSWRRSSSSRWCSARPGCACTTPRCCAPSRRGAATPACCSWPTR
jgi:adenosylmethionine-8-amino-7-oxononanoate aminotransferase